MSSCKLMSVDRNGVSAGRVDAAHAGQHGSRLRLAGRVRGVPSRGVRVAALAVLARAPGQHAAARARPAGALPGQSRRLPRQPRRLPRALPAARRLRLAGAAPRALQRPLAALRAQPGRLPASAGTGNEWGNQKCCTGIDPSSLTGLLLPISLI